jgi:hypothetical protein
VDPLYQLIRYGMAAGVAEILVADPGRPSFDELCARCLQQGDAEVRAWATPPPVRERGQFLRVGGAASNTAPWAGCVQGLQSRRSATGHGVHDHPHHLRPVG